MDKILTSVHLNELARLLNGELHGENIVIANIASIDEVKEGELTWVESEKALEEASDSPAAAYLVSRKLFDDVKDSLKVPVIAVEHPRRAFAQTLEMFFKRRMPDRGIAPTALIGKNVHLGENISIGHHAVIGDNTSIGDNATIFPLVHIGHGVQVGDGSIIYPFVSIYDRVKIGNRVIIHSGAVLGADGFGFVEIAGKQEKVPQVGIVELGDEVEIGANTTIDRATTGTTHIGNGTKIDNLVQVGHNCKLGKNCILVSQSGIAGSCTFGDNVVLAAQAGLAPHINVGSNVIIGGRSGVNHDIPSNTAVSGFPAKPHKEALKIRAAVGRLPTTMKQIKEMEKRIEELENKIKELHKTNE